VNNPPCERADTLVSVQRSAIRPSPVFLGIVGVTVLGGLLTAFDDDFDYPTTMGTIGTVLLVLGGWAVSLCLHEFGHAWFAYRGGDKQVYFKGYLTLDPRRYTDPVLSIVLPLLFLLIGAIPLPGGAVFINHHALRNKRIETMVSLAGPLANLVIGVLLAVVVSAVPMPLGLAAALSVLALFQVLAFVLNILPIPGLDGWGALEPWLPPEAQRFGAKVRPWAPLVLFALLLGVPEVGNTIFGWAYDLYTTLGGSPLAGLGYDTFKFWNF
jgi:Zn-dependent protease